MRASQEYPDVLVVAGAESTMATLVMALADRGIHADLANELQEARDTFFAKGGHGLLVLGPDLVPSIARKVLTSLTTVDPNLPVVVFGNDLLRDRVEPKPLRRIRYHPSSRAAFGAILKVLHNL